jgi:O-acetyl-ADP-ribose deacetylase (regulator of RNase III)
MPITYTTGNLLNSDCEVLVNTVNCVGVMGKGIALQFKQYFGDEIMVDYKQACMNRTLRPGFPQFIRIFGSKTYAVINFPTKDHWRNPSKIEWIDTGLQSLATIIINREIKSIAIPRLGCGLGGLDWQQVKLLIEKHLSSLECKIVVYE